MNPTSKYFFVLYFDRYPLIAHELLCHSSMLAEALVEGGWFPEEPEEAEEDAGDDVIERDDSDEEDNDTDEGEEEEQKVEEQKKFTAVALKSKVNKPNSKLMNKARLQISIDDEQKDKEDDDINERESPKEEPEGEDLEQTDAKP